jgi:hypothetical protein
VGKQVSGRDRFVIGGAAVAFVSGFLPWWGSSDPFNGSSSSLNGWSAGFIAWAGILLLVVAGLYLLLRRSGVALPALPVGPSVFVAGAAALGLALVVLRWLTLPRVHGGLNGSNGDRYGIWVALIAGIVEVTAAIIALRASGEALPWQQPTRQP